MDLCADNPHLKFAVYCTEKRPRKTPCVGMLVLESQVRRFFFPVSDSKARPISLWGIACKLKQRYGNRCVIMIWDGKRRHVVEQCTQCA